MKITQKQETSFFDKDFRSYKAILFFGPDSSRISDKVSVLVSKIIPNKEAETFSKIQLNYEDVTKDTSILVEHLSSQSLLAEQQVIILEEAGSSINKDLKAVLETYPSNDVLIVKAGELATSSSLRRFFEAEKDFAACPCYALEQRDIRSLLLSQLSENNIQCKSAVVEYIADSLNGEYGNILSEINKITLLGAAKKEILFEDAEALLSESLGNNSYYDLIKYIVRSDILGVDEEFSKLSLSGVHVVAIARNLSNYFVRLLKVKSLVEQNIQSEYEAINSLRPPIFFKNLDVFKAGLRKYSVSRLIFMIEIFTDLELECKTTNIDPILCWEKCFYKFSATPLVSC